MTIYCFLSKNDPLFTKLGGEEKGMGGFCGPEAFFSFCPWERVWRLEQEKEKRQVLSFLGGALTRATGQGQREYIIGRATEKSEFDTLPFFDSSSGDVWLSTRRSRSAWSASMTPSMTFSMTFNDTFYDTSMTRPCLPPKNPGKERAGKKRGCVSLLGGSSSMCFIWGGSIEAVCQAMPCQDSSFFQPSLFPEVCSIKDISSFMQGSPNLL